MKIILKIYNIQRSLSLLLCLFPGFKEDIRVDQRMKKNHLLVPVIATLSLIGWLCPAACQPAMIPSDSYFVDHYVITQSSVFEGTYAQSAFNASAVRRTAGTISRLPVHEDLWLLKGAFYMYLNGVCRDLPVPIPPTYIPSFSWMASSSLLQNSSKANGTPCQLWGLTVSNISIETCLAFNPDPAYAYPVRQTIRFLASTAPPTVQDYFGFHPVSDPNQFPPAIFDLPSLCSFFPPPTISPTFSLKLTLLFLFSFFGKIRHI